MLKALCTTMSYTRGYLFHENRGDRIKKQDENGENNRASRMPLRIGV